VRQVLAVVGACGLLLLVLRLATVGAESATSFGLVRLPSPTPSPAEECASFARFWMDISGDGPDAVAAVSTCRHDASGAWMVSQAGRTLGRRDATRARDIRAQLAGLETMLPVDLRHALAGLHDLTTAPESDRTWVDLESAEIRDRYARTLETYLQDPAHRKLAAYVAWVVARRDAAVATFLEGCAAYSRVRGLCDRVVRAVDAGLAPWPWELSDDLLLAEYLAQRPERDDRPSPVDATPSPTAD
jgi:hypothetical protein